MVNTRHRELCSSIPCPLQTSLIDCRYSFLHNLDTVSELFSVQVYRSSWPEVAYEIKCISLWGWLLHCTDGETEAQRESWLIQIRFIQARSNTSMRTQSSWPLIQAMKAQDAAAQWGRAGEIWVSLLRRPEKHQPKRNQWEPCSPPHGFHSNPLGPSLGWREGVGFLR